MLKGTPEEVREYKRKWVADRRAAWMADKSCVDCGAVHGDDGVVKLEIDHVDRTQKVTHAVWSWRSDRRDAELAKCVVRCEFCHDVKTRTQDFPITHGRAGYKRGCRCEVCRAGNAAMARRRMERIRKVVRIEDTRPVPALFELVARAAHLSGEVRCGSCPVVYQIDPARCIAYGWPEHCGAVMQVRTSIPASFGGVGHLRPADSTTRTQEGAR